MLSTTMKEQVRRGVAIQEAIAAMSEKDQAKVKQDAKLLTEMGIEILCIECGEQGEEEVCELRNAILPANALQSEDPLHNAVVHIACLVCGHENMIHLNKRFKVK